MVFPFFHRAINLLYIFFPGGIFLQIIRRFYKGYNENHISIKGDYTMNTTGLEKTIVNIKYVLKSPFMRRMLIQTTSIYVGALIGAKFGETFEVNEGVSMFAGSVAGWVLSVPANDALDTILEKKDEEMVEDWNKEIDEIDKKNSH